jgi:hypothetical protein
MEGAEERSLARLRREGNTADDASMVDQANPFGLTWQSLSANQTSVLKLGGLLNGLQANA